jgi:hypothetical protein
MARLRANLLYERNGLVLPAGIEEEPLLMEERSSLGFRRWHTPNARTPEALLGRRFEENPLARHEPCSVLGTAEDKREEIEPGLAIRPEFARDVGPRLDWGAAQGRAAKGGERLRLEPPRQNDHAAVSDGEDALDLEGDLGHCR